MEIVGWVLLSVAGGAAAGVGWRFYLFPGKWRYVFDEQHRAEREKVAEAHRRWRQEKAEVRRGRRAARNECRAVVGKGRLSTNEAKRRVAALQPSGPGEKVKEFGRLVLHKHALMILKEAAEGEEAASGASPGVEKEMPLEGLEVELDPKGGPENNYIRLRPGGTRDWESVAFPRSRFKEAEVAKFVSAIRSQMGKDEDLRNERKPRLEEAEANLARITADALGAEKAARRRRDEKNKALDAIRAGADARWQAARKAWRAYTASQV